MALRVAHPPTPRLRVWDTCAYIRGLADRAIGGTISSDIRRGRFLLVGVVAMELHAGARDPTTTRALGALALNLAGLGLLHVPDFSDYRLVGVALARYRSRHGAIEPARHFRDALVAACAARRAADIVTDNVRDLERWVTWLRMRPAPRVIATDDA